MIQFSIITRNYFLILAPLLCILVSHNFSFCSSLNNEGLALLRFREKVEDDPFGALSNWNNDVGILDPCSWFGIYCSNGYVVSLNLKNSSLRGTLSADLKKLVHVKSINLRNNLFSGKIPEEIGELKALEELDLGFNNFSGPLPADLLNNYSLSILLLDHNELFSSISPDILDFSILSEAQVDEYELSNTKQKPVAPEKSKPWKIYLRRILQTRTIDIPIDLPPWPPFFSSPGVNPPPPPPPPSPQVNTPSPSPSPSSLPSPEVNSPSPSSGPSIDATPSGDTASPPPSSISPGSTRSRPRGHRTLILSTSVSAALFVFGLIGAILFCRTYKVATVKPWATGLSGQLQKAFVTGVPKLKRLELETACEDFSNVLGTSAIGNVYKGTLSSGVEIAVASLAVNTAKEWSKNMEAQFRKKIETLSRVNHKNFVNLLGFCEEDQPFTRMMVFEYAPNGSLFEHLHIKEAEHLDWQMRMRIAMGMAYCLEHMHQLKPKSIPHKNLTSSSVNLSEDYAAKISDYGLWYNLKTTEPEPNPESNIYSFGVILFEIITGRAPYSVDGGAFDDWAHDYLRMRQPVIEMVDPTLSWFDARQVARIGDLIKACTHPDRRARPRMREVSARLREITEIGPEGAVPKLSPLWWAELEIMSTEAP